MTISKWMILTGINLFVVAALVHYSRSKSVTSSLSSSRRFGSANRVLIASILLYSVTQAPNVVVTCLNIASSYPFCTYNFSNASQTNAFAVTNMCLLMNYACNFLFYCTTSSKFRNRLVFHFIRLFGRKGLKPLTNNQFSIIELVNFVDSRKDTTESVDSSSMFS